VGVGLANDRVLFFVSNGLAMALNPLARPDENAKWLVWLNFFIGNRTKNDNTMINHHFVAHLPLASHHQRPPLTPDATQEREQKQRVAA